MQPKCVPQSVLKKEQSHEEQAKPSVFNHSVRGLNTALVPDNTNVLDKAMQPTTFPQWKFIKTQYLAWSGPAISNCQSNKLYCVTLCPS